MNGPDAEGFWKAMVTEIKTLEEMRVWDLAPCEPWMNAIKKSAWSFMRKTYPDGQLRKLKARACCRCRWNHFTNN